MILTQIVLEVESWFFIKYRLAFNLNKNSVSLIFMRPFPIVFLVSLEVDSGVLKSAKRGTSHCRDWK